MKKILAAITFLLISNLSAAQNEPGTTTADSSRASEPISTVNCGDSPDEQFANALRFKNDGREVEMVTCLKPAAEAGHAGAQELLGTSYGMGKGGLPMTTVYAEYWYCKSRDNGNPNASRGLGLLMSGTLYSIERIELLRPPGYKHKICDYEVLERLKKNDPKEAFGKAIKALQNQNANK